MMHNFIIFVLMLPVPQILCNRNVHFVNDNNDQLNKHIKQRSASVPDLNQQQYLLPLPLPLENQQQKQRRDNNNQAYNRLRDTTLSSDSDRYISAATDASTKAKASSIPLQLPLTRRPVLSLPVLLQSNFKANKHYGQNNYGNRFRRSSNNADHDDAPLQFVRLYFCGAGYRNCMYDERLNEIGVQHEFLKSIPRMADITLPSDYLDWKSKHLSLPPNLTVSNELSGQRQWPLVVDEPHYVLLRSDELQPQHLGPDYFDDPFIPMRGRRGNSLPYDDPFIPQRGRRTNAYDDPFIPMRGRRTKYAKPQRKPYDDPFIPMRGRKFDKSPYDDPFIPMRGKRSVQMKNSNQMRRKRSSIPPNAKFKTIYTPTEEVIVELNNDGKNDRNALKTTNHMAKQMTKKWLNEATMREQKQQQPSTLTNQLIQGANAMPLSPSSLSSCCNFDKYTAPSANNHRQQHQMNDDLKKQHEQQQQQQQQNYRENQKKSLVIPYGTVSYYDHNNPMPPIDYDEDDVYDLVALLSATRVENDKKLVSILNNLSQENRDIADLARGS